MSRSRSLSSIILSAASAIAVASCSPETFPGDLETTGSLYVALPRAKREMRMPSSDSFGSLSASPCSLFDKLVEVQRRAASVGLLGYGGEAPFAAAGIHHASRAADIGEAGISQQYERQWVVVGSVESIARKEPVGVPPGSEGRSRGRSESRRARCRTTSPRDTPIPPEAQRMPSRSGDSSL